MKKIILFVFVFCVTQVFSQYFIRGSVNDENNAPYGTGYLFLYSATGTTSREPLDVVTYTNGAFELTNVANGEYLLLALPVRDLGNNHSDTLYLATFYANKTSPVSANSITVNSFSLIDLDIQLNKRIVLNNARQDEIFVHNTSTKIPALIYNQSGELVESFLVNPDATYQINYSFFSVGTYEVHFPTNEKTLSYEETFTVDASSSTESSFMILNGPLSISNDSRITKESVYPNPCDDLLYIDNSEDLLSITVTDMKGEQRLSETSSNDHIDIKALETGIYVIKLEYLNYTERLKIKKI